MSRALYQPKGKAREYATWACNLYVGCPNGCAYCYNKTGRLAGAMGGESPSLKKCFKDEQDAYLSFISELIPKREQIAADGGIFFSFSTDPCLPETIGLTLASVRYATEKWNIPCQILTKRTDWQFKVELLMEVLSLPKDKVSFGFTLTGVDQTEPGASPNKERIRTMRQLHDEGFRTFASIEPIVDFDASTEMILQTLDFCDEYKTGLMTGNKNAYKGYDMPARLVKYVEVVRNLTSLKGIPVYFKKSITDKLP